MNSETLKLLQQVANQLGTTAQHVVEVMARQEAAIGLAYFWMCLVLTLVALIPALGLIVLGFRALLKRKEGSFNAMVVCMSLSLTAWMFVGVFGSGIADNYVKMTNPEAAAYTHILHELKQ